MRPYSWAIGLAACLVALGVTGTPALAASGGAPAPAAYDCSRGCSFSSRPVCGVDGEWYQNACIAACSGQVQVALNTTLCAGKAPPFMDMHPGPAGAESAGGNDTVPHSVVNAFVTEGFRYLGRIRLAHEMGPRPEPADELPMPERDGRGNWLVKAVRCTSEGDMYIGSMRVPARPTKLESYIPPWSRTSRPLGAFDAGNSSILDFASSLGLGSVLNLTGRAHAAASAVGAGAPAAANRTGLLAAKLRGRRERARFEGLLNDFMSLFSAPPAPQPQEHAAEGAEGAGGRQGPQRRLQQAQRLLKELVGTDDRQGCNRGFPYTAIGQIQVVDASGLYICTGTLIAPDKVLTAGHCVWNIKRGAFYYNLNYAPGRFRDGDRVVNPWGVVPWKSVTVFDSFKKNPSTWDVAVVTLAKPLGSLTGYMGLASGCGRNLALTTAGYPQDKSSGTCMAASCMQRALECDRPTNVHVCDTYMGMSGSPLWDGKNRVRMIHVAGIEGKGQNRATTMTQFLVNTVTKW